MKIAAKRTTYEFSLEEMKNLFSATLQVPVENLSVSYVMQEVGGDPTDRFRGTDEVTKIEVTVDNK